MKIYTKTGDEGTTSLIGGTRVSKFDIRLDAYGTIDELNSSLGLVKNVCLSNIENIIKLQNTLFVIGSRLALDDLKNDNHIPKLTFASIEFLESSIDELELQLDPLKEFILPGTNKSNSFIHISRTICRRAERLVCELDIQNNQLDIIKIFLNRLSDYLFVLARFESKLSGVKDLCWDKTINY